MQKPPPLDHMALTDLAPEDRIDVICDQFERDRSGRGTVDLNSYLAFCESTERPRLFVELLLVESEIAERHSQNLDWCGYVVKFPEYADQIESARFRHLSVAACRFDAPVLPVAATPKQIDHYLMLEKVGSGATASVWKAWDTQLRRAVAVKIPLFAFASEDALSRFLREGWAAAQLCHPGIVPVHAVGREADLAYIVSDYIVGRNLRDYLQDFRLAPKRAAEIGLAVAEALEHAHRHGIVHRDLKPANILLDEADKPHIADFGLAKWSEDEIATTLEGRVLGTPAYMSPEQAQGQSSKVDCRTDIFALGVILFEMLTRRRPFAGDYPQLILQLLNTDPPSARSLDRAIPKDLDTICRKAMDRQIDRRYPSAAAMAEDLTRYLQNRPILSRPVGVTGKAIRAARRRPGLTLTVVFACIACAATAIAGKLSIEKGHLLGMQTAVLATNPPGARVAFIPLHENTGQPITDGIIRAKGRSPVEQDLKAGDYLVVAALDDDRFHEVHRRVPSTSHLPGIFRHNRWKKSPDGKTILPSIDIPEKSVTQGMAYLPQDRVDPAAPAFYMDTTEFTVQQYSRSLKNWSPQGTRWESIPGNYAMTLRFDEALDVAELNGKRLPSENEYERAIRYLEIETDANRDEMLAGIGPVGAAPWDRTGTDPPILGLASNVAEWTSTAGGDPSTTPTPRYVMTTDQFVVRGGSGRLMRGETDLKSGDHDPTIRTNVGRNFAPPGLGFRCVRSATEPYVEK